MTTTLTRRDSTDVAAAPFGAGRRGNGPRVTTGLGDPDRRPVRRGRQYAWTSTRGAAAIAVVAGMTVFAGVEIGTPDGSGLAQSADMRIAEWFSAHRAPVLTPVLRLLRLVGSTVPIVVLAAVFGAWLLRRTSRPVFLVLPIATVGLTELIAQLAAKTVARPRPDLSFALMSQHGFAWPSGPVSTSVALAVSAFATLGFAGVPAAIARQIKVIAAAGAVMIAISQMVLGVQWMSDVAMGVLLGGAVATIACRRVLSAPGRRSAPRRRLSRNGRITVVGAVVFGLVPIGKSYATALRAPGAATVDVRSVEWLRDHGLSGAVDRAETWWLWRNIPSTSMQLRELPAAPLAYRPAPLPASPLVSELHVDGQPRTSTGMVPQSIPAVIRPTLPGEGVWTAALISTANEVSIATARLRPDAQHPSVVASLAWMNVRTTKFSLIRGTRQPGGGAGPAGAAVPSTQRSRLLAAFNSGYKMADTQGGAFEEGATVRPLVAGIATLGIRADGSVAVFAWGRDPKVDASMASARQNLHLLVDQGRLVGGLRFNEGGLWGRVRHALPTWRSGIGVDATGNVIYASGDGLTLDTLAESLRRAGSVNAMELDIHQKMVIFNLFTHDGVGSRPVGHKLSPDMLGDSNRYLTADQRDFVTVVSR